MDAVTQILIDRSRETDTISRMVVLSLVAHAVLIGVVAFMPAGWGAATKDDKTATMVISLGGAPGPRQGQTPISAKPVQEAAPNAPKSNVQAPPDHRKAVMVGAAEDPEAAPEKRRESRAEEDRAA